MWDVTAKMNFKTIPKIFAYFSFPNVVYAAFCKDISNLKHEHVEFAHKRSFIHSPLLHLVEL